tara:strand:+ start:650 stop:1234 length:585 start_codon:yes stop_codon:yes gene_type:complete
MKQISEMNWTDGVAKALKVAASQIEKREKDKHDKHEDYYSNPQVMLTDMLTGATVMLVTEPHTGGKTHGNGYRRCAAVEQRIPRKLPMKRIMRRLLQMSIRNFVPEDADPETIGPVVEKALKDIAAFIADDTVEDDDKHEAALNEALEKILGHTMSTRAGDTLLKMQAIPLSTAHMDVSAINAEVKEQIEVDAI